MTELKTLKDIDTLIIEKGMDNVPAKVIQAFKRDLKQEAIKIFKRLEELKKSPYFDKRDWFQNNFQENPVIVLRFLEWFFNIKEEDLKDD